MISAMAWFVEAAASDDHDHLLVGEPVHNAPSLSKTLDPSPRNGLKSDDVFLSQTLKQL